MRRSTLRSLLSILQNDFRRIEMVKTSAAKVQNIIIDKQRQLENAKVAFQAQLYAIQADRVTNSQA